MKNEIVAIEARDVDQLIKVNFVEPTTIDEYIKAGKGIVKTTQCYQALLAHYALQVCKIRHGGRSNGIYTIKDYAADIGVNGKTLQNWTLVYRRVIQHLNISPDKITSQDWTKAQKITYIEEAKNLADNREKGTLRKRDQYKDNKVSRTPDQIRKLFQDDFTLTFENELVNWNNSIVLMLGKIKKRDLSIASRKVLISFMTNLDEMSDIVNDFLSKKKR